MKNIKQKFKPLALAILGLSATTLTAMNASAIEGLELLEKIGQYPGKLKTYYAARPSAEALRQRRDLGEHMAAEAGIQLLIDNPIQLSETRLAIIAKEDSSATFEVDSITGNFLFNAGLMKYREEESTQRLPKEEEAVELSNRWLQEYELKVDSTELELAHVGGLNMAIPDGAGGSRIFEKLKTVRFSRVLEDLPVEGDTRIVMHLGERGTLAGLVYQWPQIEKEVILKDEQLQDLDAIRSRALDRIEGVTGKEESARLTTADLVLYDDGLGVVEPAYHFVVERYFDYGDDELVMIPYDFYLPTTKKPAAYYPYMETALIAPENGEDEGEMDSGKNE